MQLQTRKLAPKKRITREIVNNIFTLINLQNKIAKIMK